MGWTDDELYARSLARDDRLDGRVYMAVHTTGIYCRLSCTARKPKREHVTFFRDEAAARAAGFRPCRRCRPDAPGEDRELDGLEALLARIHAEPEAYRTVDDLAAALGCGATALGDRFRRHGLPSPAQVLAAARVDRLADRLAEGGATVLEAALDAGFESLSAANDRFRRQLALSPGAWRKLGSGHELVLALPGGYRAEDTLAFHGRDPQSACEQVEGSTLVKALEADGRAVRLTFVFTDGQVRVRAEEPIRPHHAAVRRMLGLHLDPTPFERAVGGAFARILRPGLRLPQTADGWEALVWAILGQQVNLAFAYALRRDLVARFGLPLGNGRYAHPGPARLAQAEVGELTALRLSRAKAETLLRAAQTAAAGCLDLEALRLGTATRAEGVLRTIKGIGPWTARYVLLRGLGFGDVVPAGDAGLALALQRHHNLDHRPDAAETEALLAAFSPWRSFAVYHLWASLKGSPA